MKSCLRLGFRRGAYSAERKAYGSERKAEMKRLRSCLRPTGAYAPEGDVESEKGKPEKRRVIKEVE
jgi:hypothetical protein